MSTNNLDNAKRIARNTIMLYIRMFFIMLIGLYTSRVILNVLGVSDYGVYNVVGGVVAMFSLLTTSLSSSISRFTTFELGRGDTTRLNKIFSTAINVQLIMSCIIVLATEIIGVWFLNTKMNIPADRMVAANWVMQCSIISFVLGLFMVPYNAAIIAHERMSAFAYIGILEVVLKLAIVYALLFSPIDKLITYAILQLGVSILLRFIYATYCHRNFAECKYHYVYDKQLLKEMVAYAGWGFLGNGSWILNNQGINILINLFFGVVLNAARGIASQVDTLIQNFVRNFMTALNPQITKSYAAGNFEYMHKLVLAGARYSYYLMLFFVLPIFLETPIILKLWLKIVPDYTVIFLRFTLLSSMCVIIGNTLITSIHATGKIRNYELVMGTLALSNFPLVWIAFSLGASPVAAYVIYLIIYFILIFVRLYMAKDMIHLSAWRYIKEVLLRVTFVSLLSLILPLIIYWTQSDSIIRLVEIVITSTFSTVLSVWFVGMNQSERLLLTGVIMKKLKK